MELAQHWLGRGESANPDGKDVHVVFMKLPCLGGRLGQVRTRQHISIINSNGNLTQNAYNLTSYPLLDCPSVMTTKTRGIPSASERIPLSSWNIFVRTLFNPKEVAVPPVGYGMLRIAATTESLSLYLRITNFG